MNDESTCGAGREDYKFYMEYVLIIVGERIMIINKTRINKLETQFKNLDIKEGDNLVVSVFDIGRFDNLNK